MLVHWIFWRNVFEYSLSTSFFHSTACLADSCQWPILSASQLMHFACFPPCEFVTAYCKYTQLQEFCWSLASSATETVCRSLSKVGKDNCACCRSSLLCPHSPSMKTADECVIVDEDHCIGAGFELSYRVIKHCLAHSCSQHVMHLPLSTSLWACGSSLPQFQVLTVGVTSRCCWSDINEREEERTGLVGVKHGAYRCCMAWQPVLVGSSYDMQTLRESICLLRDH